MPLVVAGSLGLRGLALVVVCVVVVVAGAPPSVVAVWVVPDEDVAVDVELEVVGVVVVLDRVGDVLLDVVGVVDRVVDVLLDVVGVVDVLLDVVDVLEVELLLVVLSVQPVVDNCRTRFR
jgi:hypothetical protein